MRNPASVVFFLLGFRLIVISYLFLQPFYFLLFVGLLISCFLKFEKGKKKEPFCYLFFVLAWFEESCAFRYLGNVYLGPSLLLLLFALSRPDLSFCSSYLALFSFLFSSFFFQRQNLQLSWYLYPFSL